MPHEQLQGPLIGLEGGGAGTEVPSNSSQLVPFSVYPSQPGGQEATLVSLRGHWSTFSSSMTIQADEHRPPVF